MVRLPVTYLSVDAYGEGATHDDLLKFLSSCYGVNVRSTPYKIIVNGEIKDGLYDRDSNTAIVVSDKNKNVVLARAFHELGHAFAGPNEGRAHEWAKKEAKRHKLYEVLEELKRYDRVVYLANSDGLEPKDPVFAYERPPGILGVLKCNPPQLSMANLYQFLDLKFEEWRNFEKWRIIEGPYGSTTKLRLATLPIII